MAKEEEKVEEKESLLSKAKNLITAENARIKNWEAILMIVICFLFFDLLQFVLDWLIIGIAINWIISIFAWLTIFFWFQLKGISFMNPARLVTMLATALVDFIPGNAWLIITGFPWTVGVIVLLALSRVEDATGLAIPVTPKNVAKFSKNISKVGQELGNLKKAA